MLRLLKSTPKTSRSISKRVFVGLSGGVDSAVSAALLKEQGFDVTGVFIKVWQPDFLPCTWREERRDAMRAAARLDIPFLFLDFSEEYKRGVADYMIEEYRRGRTPNPDVLCNREVKFGAFWQKAKELGADYIATGHYARNIDGKLLEGVDKGKDQSYFLWMLTLEDLKHIIFPVGGMKKNEVRRLANKLDLPTAEKKDSQGICFLGDVDIEGFLSHFIKAGPGDVLDVGGRVIGRHDGALFYTLGERHGFDVFKKSHDSKPLFVIAKDMRANTITVAEEISSLPDEIHIERANWMQEPGKSLEARIRYRQAKALVEVDGDRVKFGSPQTASPGQSIVFYKGEECLGGAIIV